VHVAFQSNNGGDEMDAARENVEHSMNKSVRIGISGWRYPPWRGSFYPKDLPQANELAFAAKSFQTIEINGTFYSLKTPKNFMNWTSETPDDFIFSVKAPRYITHILRLRNITAAVANFFANGLLCLGPKLGPILWQFPPSFKFDTELLESFFKILPHDTDAARTLAQKHDQKVAGRVHLEVAKKRRVRHAMEIRHKSFVCPEFIALLRKHHIALVCADTVEWPRLMDVTADFVYCRLHGSEELYKSGYDDEALDNWARRIMVWVTGKEPTDAQRASSEPASKRTKRDVFLYFDNDVKVLAPVNARSLIERIESRA
jgi:uncharacterized protein YecE (DUF72 family)